jgi:hypothetical protein
MPLGIQALDGLSSQAVTDKGPKQVHLPGDPLRFSPAGALVVGQEETP